MKTQNLDLAAIPAVVKHMTLAILENKYGIAYGDPRAAKAPEGKKNFVEAFTIARSRLAEYGHLNSSSVHGPVTKIKLTGSGRALEMKHQREPKSRKKSAHFDVLYERFLALKADSAVEKRTGG